MPKTYTNALVFDKEFIEIDPVVRRSLQTFYQRNLFMDSIDKNPPSTIIDKDEDVCMKLAAEMNFDYLILTWEGNIFDIQRYHHVCVDFINSLDEKTNGDWLVAGQLINQHANRKFYKDPEADKWKDSVWLFPITAIVNVKKWVELGRPSWGQQESLPQTVVKCQCSEESVHDGYTPLVVHPTEEQVRIHVKKGWNIINASMAAGMPVYNLSNEIRNNQTYLYPEVNVERYNNFWKSIHLMPKLTDQYKRVLDSIISSKNPMRIDSKSWSCFIKNTEDYFPREDQPVVDFSSVDTLMLPCSGFKDFIFSMTKLPAGKSFNFIHYDIIKECVEIRQKIIERWDGSRDTFKPTVEAIAKEYRPDPHRVFHMHSMKDLSEVYDFILTFFASEEELKTRWQYFKNCKHEFIEADMLDDPYSVLKLVKSKNIYLCLSDIAGWRNNILSYGYLNLRNDILKCLFSIRKRGFNCIVDYKDPATDLQMWQPLEEAITYLKSEPPVLAMAYISG
jgi:hypothetical protein